jgi:DNA-binding PadR family transcriptional regulator
LVEDQLSVTEYAVLGLLAEDESHGFALAKKLEAESEVGRVFTVRRPLVYRALDRLVTAGLARAVTTEKGTAGPKRTVHAITDEGRSVLEAWLARPVEHIRDLRIEFLLKVALLERSGRSPLQLIESQQSALDGTLEALDRPEGVDHVELWRQHNAAAAAAYLEQLNEMYTSP